MTISELSQTETEENALTGQSPASTKQRAILLLVAGLVVVVDHFSKLFVESQLALNQSWAPFPELAHLFRITHVSNTGAAFGFFPGGGLLFTIVAMMVAAIIVFYNFGLPSGHILLRLALGMQLGGALGNLVDRLRLGHVTDFLDFGPWPVFNLADTSIVAGVVILGFLMLTERREPLAGEQSGNEIDSAQSSLSSMSGQRQNEQAT